VTHSTNDKRQETSSGREDVDSCTDIQTATEKCRKTASTKLRPVLVYPLIHPRPPTMTPITFLPVQMEDIHYEGEMDVDD